ncbi:hypothetical protein ACFL3L_02915 [Candidatus Neomarinimicrobiota bacterium]
MEGIGYWIFLIIIYALSSYLRKKQRSRAVENKEEESQAASKPKTSQADFLRQIFGEIEKEIIPERKDVLLEDEVPIEDESDIPELIHKERKPLPIEPVPVEEISTFRFNEDKLDSPGKISDVAFKKPEYATKVKSNRLLGILKSMVKGPDSLQRSIILKEILGKPRALRHTIR